MAKTHSNHGKTIALAGNQSVVVDVLDALQSEGYQISHLLNMGEEHASVIADYHDFARLAGERGVALVRPVDYPMLGPETRSMFDGVTIDMLISVGWQRLFPDWFLKRLSIGAFGMHGSSEPLPRGRGRSPMVWSILENKDRFITNLFRYDEGADSGMIVGSLTFDILPRDTIRTLQHKNALAQIQLLLKHLPDLLTGRAKLQPQPTNVRPTYYPKRVPEDGVIDWRETASAVDRLVRAVTKPYPGSFSFIDERKILIWEGMPFDGRLKFPDADPGRILAAFHDGTFLVQCSDLPFLVTDWEGPKGWKPMKDGKFASLTNPGWEKLRKMGDHAEVAS